MRKINSGLFEDSDGSLFSLETDENGNKFYKRLTGHGKTEPEPTKQNPPLQKSMTRSEADKLGRDDPKKMMERMTTGGYAVVND